VCGVMAFMRGEGLLHVQTCLLTTRVAFLHTASLWRPSRHNTACTDESKVREDCAGPTPTAALTCVGSNSPPKVEG
jgi:hypothetical protein